MTDTREVFLTTQTDPPRTITLKLGESRNRFVIGSSDTADVRLADNGIAPRHAQISLNATGRVDLTTLGSDCPVLCNDRPILTTTPLNDGDLLQIGGIKLHVGIPTVDQPEAQMTAASGQNPATDTPGSRHGSGSRGLGSARGSDPFIELAMAELSQAYPDKTTRRTRRELQALIERGRERARGYGFEQKEHILKFLHCVMLLDDELARATNSDVAYVLDTLTVPNKPPDRRIDRALAIAKRIAEHNIKNAPPPAPSAPPGSSQSGAPPSRTPRSSPPPHSGAPFLSPRTSPAPVPPAAPEPARRLPAVTRAEASAQSTSNTAPPQLEEIGPKDSAFPDIEGFRIIEQIAAGGMGTVYRAHDLQLDIEVAIKVLRSMHASAQQQFLLEARAAAKLQHPHIVPVLRYEQYGQGGYCVMQLVKGKDGHRLVKLLGEKIAHDLPSEKLMEVAGIDPSLLNPELRAASRGPQPYYRFVAYWVAGVAEGLDRAHGEGIIHYDVKPSNMMLAADGRMLLGDFGLATLRDKQAAHNAACVGTPGYLAPELLAAWAARSGTTETDARVDIWGLGLTLYEFLTYKPAFDGTVARVLRAIATSEPPPPRDIAWNTPPGLEHICMKAIARNPDDRYHRASEMADELREWLAGRGPETKQGDSPSFFSRLRRPKPKV